MKKVRKTGTKIPYAHHWLKRPAAFFRAALARRHFQQTIEFHLSEAGHAEQE